MKHPKGGYPTDIVTGDGWERIHVGHGLDREVLRADYEHCHGPLDDGDELIVEQTWFGYTPRVKWCEKYGWPCDEEGEWHGHWYAVQPSPGREYTIVSARRTDVRTPARG